MVKILVPMDFSREAYLALDWAAKLAAESASSEIYLANVSPIDSDAREQDRRLAGVRKQMADLKTTVTSGPALIAVYLVGRVADEVSQLCRRERIDLVVMTTRGRFGLSRELEGSITEETVRLAPCPVLVLHLNQTTAMQVQQRFRGFFPAADDGIPL